VEAEAAEARLVKLLLPRAAPRMLPLPRQAALVKRPRRPRRPQPHPLPVVDEAPAAEAGAQQAHKPEARPQQAQQPPRPHRLPTT